MNLSNKCVIDKLRIGDNDYFVSGRSYVASAAEWNSSGYTPDHGEIIVYRDGEKVQLKVGDGATSLDQLPFIIGTIDGTEALDNKMDRFGAVVDDGYGAKTVSVSQDLTFEATGLADLALQIASASAKEPSAQILLKTHYADGTVNSARGQALIDAQEVLIGQKSDNVQIANLAAPISDKDAANKEYVDNLQTTIKEYVDSTLKNAVESIVGAIRVDNGTAYFPSLNIQ